MEKNKTKQQIIDDAFKAIETIKIRGREKKTISQQIKNKYQKFLVADSLSDSYVPKKPIKKEPK